MADRHGVLHLQNGDLESRLRSCLEDINDFHGPQYRQRCSRRKEAGALPTLTVLSGCISVEWSSAPVAPRSSNSTTTTVTSSGRETTAAITCPPGMRAYSDGSCR